MKWYFNGVNGLTGRYSHVSDPSKWPEPEELLRWIQLEEDAAPVEPKLLADEVRRFIKKGDSAELKDAKWGVIVSEADDHADDKVRRLKSLLDLRKADSGLEEKDDIVFLLREGESVQSFYKRKKVPLGGRLDTDKLPYYLMIVAPPDLVRWSTQYRLSARHAVGRLDFGKALEEYERYADQIVKTEKAEAARRKAEIAFLATRHDGCTEVSHRRLIEPLASRFYERTRKELCALGGLGRGTKTDLGELLTSEARPGVLFTATHGIHLWHFQQGHRENLGALLCQEWPGEPEPRNCRPYYFAAHDLDKLATTVDGLVAFLFGCYTAGFAATEDFARFGERDAHKAPEGSDFVARLPQRLLTCGASAVIGTVGATWELAFRQPVDGEPDDEDYDVSYYEDFLKELLDGKRVGYAFWWLTHRYMEFATLLSETTLSTPEDELYNLYFSRNTARNMVLLGDPAAKLQT